MPKAKPDWPNIKCVHGTAGIIAWRRYAADGQYEFHLVPSMPRAEGWLKDHAHLLSKSLVSWQTKRFGGQLSGELGELATQWAKKVRGATLIEQEVSGGFQESGTFSAKVFQESG